MINKTPWSSAKQMRLQQGVAARIGSASIPSQSQSHSVSFSLTDIRQNWFASPRSCYLSTVQITI